MRATTVLALALFAGCASEQSFSKYVEPAEEPVETSTTTTPAPVDTGTPAPDPELPVAEAGPDEEWSPLDVVQLDGTGSYDPDGTVVAMDWTMLSAPAGSTASLDDATAPKPSFFADLAGDYVFELTVQDDDGQWDPTPDTVTITTTPIDGMYVELSWDANADLDLHFSRNGVEVYDKPNDVCYCNENPSWGAAGAADDPSLDYDSYGYGPETITVDAPEAGVYTVAVVYYGQGGNASCNGSCPETAATVNIYLSGTLAASFTETLNNDGQVWDVATVDLPLGQVSELADFYRTTRIDCF